MIFGKNGNSKKALLAALVVVVLAAGFAVYLLTRHESRSGLYGVFLSNGQVYFGTIASESDKKLVLKGIYYIQLKNDVKDGTTPSDVSLLKLGNEIHGPEDYMEINQNNVLFIEKLKPDGKVAKAIDSYKEK